MGEQTERDIPLPIRREVRQRCGFGCVVCGMPLYEYEHMLGFANVRRHVAEEITLLCDQHHRERTSGLLPIDQVIEANHAPYNLREGVSKPYNLYYSGVECEAVIGGNRFTTQDQGHGTVMVPVSVDDIPLIGFILSDGHLLLNLNVFDENNNLVLRIVNNELFYAASPWDIELVGKNLLIRESQRNFLVDMTFEPPHTVRINRGRLLCNGVEIIIRPEHILVTNNRTLVTGCQAINCPGGLVIGPHERPLGGFMSLQGISRYQGDRRDAERWARESMDHWAAVGKKP